MTTISNATMGLIPVSYNNEEITVLGRDLHAALKVGTDYRHWIKRMIEYGFEDGIDYVQFFENDLGGTNLVAVEKDRQGNIGENLIPQNKTNHQMKLDMAKEIAMIQRSEAGRKVRKYFIEVEKKYRSEKIQSKAVDLHIPEYDARARALMSAGNCAVILNSMLGVDLGIARAHSINQAEKDFGVNLAEVKKLLPASENVVVGCNPTQLAKKLTEKTGTKYSARKINNLLLNMGYQRKENEEWVLTEAGKQYGGAYPYERNGHTGFQILWNEEILDYLMD